MSFPEGERADQRWEELDYKWQEGQKEHRTPPLPPGWLPPSLHTWWCAWLYSASACATVYTHSMESSPITLYSNYYNRLYFAKEKMNAQTSYLSTEIWPGGHMTGMWAQVCLPLLPAHLALRLTTFLSLMDKLALKWQGFQKHGRVLLIQRASGEQKFYCLEAFNCPKAASTPPCSLEHMIPIILGFYTICSVQTTSSMTQ